MPRYIFFISCFGPLAICFHSHHAFDSSRHCCRVHRSDLTRGRSPSYLQQLLSSVPVFSFPVHAGNQRSAGVGRSPPTALHLLPSGETSDSSYQPRQQPHRELWPLTGPCNKLWGWSCRWLPRRCLSVATRQESVKEKQTRSFAHPQSSFWGPRSSFHSGCWLEPQRQGPQVGHFYPSALTVTTDSFCWAKRHNVQSLHAVTVRHKWYEFKTFFLSGLWESWFTYCMCVWGWEF